MRPKRGEKFNTKTYALSQHICMSAHKARRIINQIRGRSYEEIISILEIMPYRTCNSILKLIYSAAANASHNMNFNKETLVISKTEVNKGTTMKKSKAQAQGRNSLIKRTTCHITIGLKDISLSEYAEYIVWFNKTGCISKKKYTDMVDVWDKK
uniref:Large ribosomal subunit protein uL22c n=1 Tax=Helixanthera parasitica TaxID=227895 RepID=A0A344KYT7_9MAGN|nr:ribosomal protein L22 [Helixanthera parasitica]AXB38573.1 ribosomal protein L22 [Helixanthera parasitica]QQY86337.1 ribosomal protein L22 [Helixanthera parasitica]